MYSQHCQFFFLMKGGVVNQVAPDHIGLLVYNLFNVSIDKKGIGDELAFDYDANAWKSGVLERWW